MKIRDIKTGEIGESSKFNMSSLSEIIVYFDDCDSAFQKDFEVFIEAEQRWMTFKEAWEGKHIITDNHNTCFHEPRSNEERERGYSW